MRSWAFLPKSRKLRVTTLILVTIFLFLLTSTSAKAWLWDKKIKEISDEEVEAIKTELNISEDSRFYSYSNSDLKEALDEEMDSQKAPGLTYGIYILNAINEEELVDLCSKSYFDDREATHFFSILADNLASWQKNFAEKTTKLAIKAAIEACKMHGLSIGTSSLFLAVDLVQINISIKKLEEVIRNRALWHYIASRKMNDSHEGAWGTAPVPVKYRNKQTEDYFKSLWDKYGEHVSESGLNKDFKQQQHEILKTSLLYALGAKAHPVITSPLTITPSPPYSVGDTVNAEFTITNKGAIPITFSVLTVGGRDPDDQVADFAFRRTITLNSNQSYNYKGTLTLTKAGKYHFFCAYQTPDGNWNTSVDLGDGLTDQDRMEDIAVEGEIISSQSAIKEAVEELQPFFDLSTPENIVRSFYESLHLGRSRQIKKCWSWRSAPLVEAISAAAETTQVEELIKKLMRMKGASQEEQQDPKAIKQILREYLSSIRYQRSQISHNSCYVTAIEKVGGEIYMGIYKLVKENDNWEILYNKDWEKNEEIMALILPEKQKEAKGEQTKKTEEKAELPDEEKANKLYVEAHQLLESAFGLEETSYSEASTLYKDALVKLETIISEYPSSNIAVEIVKENTITNIKRTLHEVALRADAEKSPFGCAFYLVKKWYTGGGDPRQEFDEVSSIATKYAEIGQKDKALKILDELLSKAKGVRDSEYRGGALAIVATRYAEIGEFSQALRILDQNGIPEVVIALPTKHADLDQLNRLFGAIRAGWSYSQEWGLETVKALIKIAGRYAELGEKNQAEQILAETLDETRRSPEGLIEIASKYTELGQRNKALEALGEAFKAAKLLVSDREDYLAQVAIEYAKLDQFEQALEVVKAIAPDFSCRSEVRALVQIAARYVELGQRNKAAATFEEAVNAAEWKGAKPWVFTQIASKYAELDQKEKALEILDEAITLDLAPILEIARKYAELGQPDKALRIAGKASETDTPSSWAKWQTFGDIAVKYGEVGQFERVHQILGQMRYEKKSSRIAGSRVGSALEYTLCKLAPTWAKLGKFEEALQTTEEISSETRKAETLMEIDLEYAQLGQDVKESEKKILHRIVRDTHSK